MYIEIGGVAVHIGQYVSDRHLHSELDIEIVLAYILFVARPADNSLASRV